MTKRAKRHKELVIREKLEKKYRKYHGLKRKAMLADDIDNLFSNNLRALYTIIAHNQEIIGRKSNTINLINDIQVTDGIKDILDRRKDSLELCMVERNQLIDLIKEKISILKDIDNDKENKIKEINIKIRNHYMEMRIG